MSSKVIYLHGENRLAVTVHGRDLSGTELAELVDEFVNKANESDMKEFAEQLTTRTHRTLQQKAMRLFLVAIEAWADIFEKGSGWYDPRNEATVKLAAKIVKATGDKYDRFLPLI